MDENVVSGFLKIVGLDKVLVFILVTRITSLSGFFALNAFSLLVFEND